MLDCVATLINMLAGTAWGAWGVVFWGWCAPMVLPPPWGLRHFAMAYEAKSSLPTYSYPPAPMYQFIASYAMANPINALT